MNPSRTNPLRRFPLWEIPRQTFFLRTITLSRKSAMGKSTAILLFIICKKKVKSKSCSPVAEDVVSIDTLRAGRERLLVQKVISRQLTNFQA